MRAGQSLRCAVSFAAIAGVILGAPSLTAETTKISHRAPDPRNQQPGRSRVLCVACAKACRTATPTFSRGREPELIITNEKLRRMCMRQLITGVATHLTNGGTSMTKLLLSAMIAAGLGLAPAAFAEDAMKKTDTKPMADNMKKKDAMKKTDNMKKSGDTKSDMMKK
jgi:pentapeptide MXKDX repeat protein